MIALVTPLVTAMRMEVTRRKKVIVWTVGVVLLSIFGELVDLTNAGYAALEFLMNPCSGIWMKVFMGIRDSFHK